MSAALSASRTAPAEKTRFEIGVCVQIANALPITLRLVTWAAHEGDAILLAHGQVSALMGNQRKGVTVSFSS